MEQKKTVLYTVIAGTISGLTAVALFAQSGFLISKAALMPPFYVILILAAFLKLFGVAKSTSKYAERLLSHQVTFHLMSRIRESYFNKLLQQTTLFHRFKSGDLLHRITTDVETLQHYFLRVFYPPLVAGIVFLVTILFSLIFSWQIAVVLMLGYIISAFFIPAIFSKWLRDRSTSRKEQLSSKTTEYLYGYETLQHFNELDVKTDELLTISDHYALAQVQHERQIHLAHSLNQLFALLAALLVLLLGAFAVTTGALQGVYLAMLLMVTLTVFELATPLASMSHYAAATNEANERLQDITAHTAGQVNVEQLMPIQFNNVSYQYEHGISPALRAINFSIHEGEKLAIIGVSGSGKTTLLHMLLKELTPQQGSITCNGINLLDIEDASLFSQLSVQLQHNHFFIGTVRENLQLAKPDAADDEMLTVLQVVNLPLQLDESVQEKALNFSGGERQRLAYARVLLQNAACYLLDEPFSSVDATLRQQLTMSLCERPNCVLMITHETDCLHYFDRVLKLENGILQEVRK